MEKLAPEKALLLYRAARGIGSVDDCFCRHNIATESDGSIFVSALYNFYQESHDIDDDNIYVARQEQLFRQFPWLREEKIGGNKAVAYFISFFLKELTRSV